MSNVVQIQKNILIGGRVSMGGWWKSTIKLAVDFIRGHDGNKASKFFHNY